MSEWRHRLPASAGATGFQPVALVRCRRSLRCCASKTYPFSSNSSCRPFTTRTITTTTTTTTHIAISSTINISFSSSTCESQASDSKALSQWLSTVAAQPENPRLSASSPRLSASGPNLFSQWAPMVIKKEKANKSWISAVSDRKCVCLRMTVPPAVSGRKCIFCELEFTGLDLTPSQSPALLPPCLYEE